MALHAEHSRTLNRSHLITWPPIPLSGCITTMNYIFCLLLAVILIPWNLLCFYGWQWICRVKQEVGIPQNISAHPETLPAVLLSCKSGSSMPFYSFQLNRRCVWLYSLGSLQSAPLLFFLFVFSPFSHGSHSGFGCCSVSYALKCTGNASSECRFVCDSVSASPSFHLFLSLNLHYPMAENMMTVE